jgi:acetyltransferase-like isoleucine patch superfamily enzyme
MTSKTKLVRILLRFRTVFILFWKYTPKSLSKFLISFLRNSNSKLSYGVRYLCLNRLAKNCGEKVIIFPGVFLKNLENLSVGTNVSIHEMSYIDAFGGVEIGNDVAISHNVSIISFDHDLSRVDLSIKDAPPVKGKVSIKNNVWVGAGARILKGVEICSDSVIASGSVVNKNVPYASVVGGVPAKVIKNIIKPV